MSKVEDEGDHMIHDILASLRSTVITPFDSGLYGKMAYDVARRTNEIGIRMAPGAKRSRIVWMTQREVLLLVGAGSIVGTTAAWGVMSIIRSFVFGMKAADPLAMIAAIGLLMAAANLAGCAPAARASKLMR